MKRLIFNKLFLLICIYSHLVSYSQISFEKNNEETLWNSVNKYREIVECSEYKHMVIPV